LGKGLEALLPQEQVPTSESVGAAPEDLVLSDIAIAQIHVNRYQPRREFDEESLASLTASIQELGVLQPVLVRPTDEGFELIAGERRWRAAQAAGLSTVPALVRTVEDEGALEQALVENLHREDLNPLEEAAGYQQLIDEFGLTQDAVARRVGRSRSAIANTIRLLQLPEDLQAHVVSGGISAGHARALLACEDAAEQRALADKIVAEGMTVRDTEEAVRRLVAARYSDGDAAEPVEPGSSRPAPLLELEEMLSDHLDTRVKVAMSGSRGRVVIEFATVEDLERVYRVITGGRDQGAGSVGVEPTDD
jgi:ParB family chromosome partitioning protein